MDVKLGIIAGGIAAALATPVVAQEGPDQVPADGVFKAELLTLNNSGVSGTAFLAKEGDELTVIMKVDGYEPGVEHLQHIHGLADGEGAASCPTLAQDANGDNLVDLQEGLPAYGGIVLPLEPFPTPADETPVAFSATYQLDTDTAAALQQPATKTIVLHGLTVQGTFNATHPVACGEIRPLSPADSATDSADDAAGS